MSLITNADLQAVVDKAARYAKEVIDAMQTVSSTVFDGGDSIATYVLALNNLDVEADLLPPARDLAELHPTLPDNFFGSLPGFISWNAALDAHVVRYAAATSLDGYLTSLNNPTPTLRVHGYYRSFVNHKINKLNSFTPADYVIATFHETGATTGTLAKASAFQYGPAKFVIKNKGALTTSAVVTVTALKPDGSTDVITATLSTHTDNFETDLSDTGKKYTGVSTVAITTGTNGDEFEIVAKTDRDISAA